MPQRGVLGPEGTDTLDRPSPHKQVKTVHLRDARHTYTKISSRKAINSASAP
jgi:hypothetical protein